MASGVNIGAVRQRRGTGDGARVPAGLLAGLCAAVFLAATPTPARAAVKSCKPLVIGAAREAGDELLAKKLALESWLGLAQQYGPQYTRWQLAHSRILRCGRLSSGQSQCQAAGAPCVILQVPAPPPGAPGMPGVPGVPGQPPPPARKGGIAT